MSLTTDIKDKLSRLNVLEKIIAVNVIFFILGLLLNSSLSWLELPSDFSSFIFKPWSIISYAFLHYDFLHILFNMLWLYAIGRMFLNLFSPKMALNIYSFVTSKPDGVGLGLAIAKQVVTDHRGTIAWSRENGTTRFRVELPIASEPVPSEATVSEGDRRGQTARR